MSLIILLEAMKIHKLRHERTAQLWFLLLYAINLLPLVLPVGDRDFSRLAAAFETLSSGSLDIEPAWVLLTAGNWLTLGLILLANIITLFFSLMYATLFVGERDGMTPRQAAMRCLGILPSMFLLVVMLLVPAVLSACLAFIPLIIFLVMIYFLPLCLTLDKRPLVQALQASLDMTRQRRLFIFFKVLLLSLILSLPQNLVTRIAAGSALPFYALTTFFIVLQALMQGRLMGILYLSLVKKVPLVIPSQSKPGGPQ